MALTDAELLATVEEKAAAPADEANTETTEEVTDEVTDETTDEVVAEGEEPAGEETDEPAPEVFKVKIDGEETEVSREELLRGYSTNKAAQQKFQDASVARKQAEEFINILKTDPMSILTRPELGIDMRQLSEHYLADQLNYEQLSEEQKELLNARQQLAQVEQDKRAREQQEYDANVEKLANEYQEEYTTRINTALTDASLPVTEATIRRMANYLSEALSSDDPAIQKLSDVDIVELVREDYVADIKSMLGEANAETLQNMLGSDISKTLRQADIAQLKGKPPSRTSKPVKGKQRGKEEPKKMNTNEWNDFLDSF